MVSFAHSVVPMLLPANEEQIPASEMAVTASMAVCFNVSTNMLKTI